MINPEEVIPLTPIESVRLAGREPTLATGSQVGLVSGGAGASKSPNVDLVLDKADALAREFRHHEVTLFHLMYALTMLPAGCKRLRDVELDASKVRQVAWRELAQIPERPDGQSNGTPPRSKELRDIDEAALTLARSNQDSESATVHLLELVGSIVLEPRNTRVYSLFSGTAAVPTDEETRQSIGAIRTQLAVELPRMTKQIEDLSKGVFVETTDPETGIVYRLAVSGLIGPIQSQIQKNNIELENLGNGLDATRKNIIDQVKRLRNWLIGLCLGLGVSFLVASLAVASMYLKYGPQ